MNRRDLLLAMAGAPFALTACKTQSTGNIDPVVVRARPVVPLKALDPLLEDIHERTFNFFWDTAEPETGLVPDRWPHP
ncbi:MAG TPA: hypothetical protein VFL16_17565, partial [Steroidobacteraceae bacterium]|nr:hypothetical protein [Steroidobacteraceae bacterium]